MRKKEHEIYKGYYSNHTALNQYTVIKVIYKSGNFKMKRIWLKIFDYIIGGTVSFFISLLLQYFLSR